ncbi:MAG: hypothetical protein AAB654_00375 [Acidobacteriota bacterium]
MTREVEAALELLRGNARLIEDAKIGARVNNSIAGSLLTRPLGPIGARQYAEAAVREALKLLAREAK